MATGQLVVSNQEETAMLYEEQGSLPECSSLSSLLNLYQHFA
jgi:hypothetical protein